MNAVKIDVDSAVNLTANATETDLLIGDPFGGGFYIGTIDGHYIIAATKDTEKTAHWKTSNTKTAGTDSNNNGSANTAAMANEEHPAAFFCSQLTANGYSDWYLPARDELALLVNANNKLPRDQMFSGTYWSSTQLHKPESYTRFFYSGRTGYPSEAIKMTRYYVRAVRRVKI